MNKQSKKVKLCVIWHAAKKNNRAYFLRTEITKSREIFSLHDFFLLTACAGIFFQINVAFFSVRAWVIYFALYKLLYTQNRSKDTGHFLIMCATSFRKCTERGRRSPECTASPYIFSVLVLLNSSPPTNLLSISWRISRFESFFRTRMGPFCGVR